MSLAAGTGWVADRLSELRERISSIRSPSLTIPVVAAADVDPHALAALEAGTLQAIRHLHRSVRAAERLLREAPPANGPGLWRANHVLALLQLKADALFRTLDVFSDGLSARTDAEVGVLLKGTDCLVAAALDRRIPGYSPPAAITYLESAGRGGAIARARTRFPGGVVLPIALVRVSPETLPARLTSLLHEAGHQLNSDLNLLEEGARVIEAAALGALRDPGLARQWASFTSELLADAWGYVIGGIPAVDGLQRVLSLPATLLHLVRAGDPHPPGMVRVAFGLAFTRAVHPAPLLDLLDRRFAAVYGSAPVPRGMARHQAALGGAVPAITRALLSHRFIGLGRRTLVEAGGPGVAAPVTIRRFLHRAASPVGLAALPPLTALAVLGTSRLLGIVGADRYDLVARSWLRALARNRLRQAIPDRLNRPVATFERIAS